jgi:RNA binding exosome subunit
VCEETCVLPDNFIPKKLDVQLQNTSAIRINNINIIDAKNDLPSNIKNNITNTITQLKSSQSNVKLEKIEDMIDDN